MGAKLRNFLSSFSDTIIKLGANPRGLPLSKEIEKKIYFSLIDYVHKQVSAGLISTLFCATVLLIGLYTSANRTILLAWYCALVFISIIRFSLAHIYNMQQLTLLNKLTWGQVFVFFAALSGLCWGFAGTVLLPDQPGLPQVLVILILSGVAAGAVPLFSGLLRAAIVFLLLITVPVIIHLTMIGIKEYLLLASTIVLYLIYLIVLSIQFHNLIAQTIYFEFKNDELVNELLSAKTKLEASNLRLEHTATHDPLTGVSNRNLFTIKLQDAIKRAERQQKMLGIFYIDLDKFKNVNDSFGHDIGDKLLIQVVNRIQAVLRADDVLARLGGDEFAVIVENLSTIEPLNVLADTICTILNAPFQIDDLPIKVTATIGISAFPENGQNPEELIKAADKTMYLVKSTRPGSYYSLTGHTNPYTS